jgi:hypothetical protein
MDGCKYEDEFAPAGCPFKYGQDFVDHGTHIAGTNVLCVACVCLEGYLAS